MPSLGRRRARRAGRSASAEADLLAAAQRLLDGGTGFAELGVEQITTEAGVARSAFALHFRDKTELLLRMATEYIGPSYNAASAWEPQDGVEGLAEAFLKVLTIHREHAAVRRALTEVAGYDETVRDFLDEAYRRFTDHTIATLRTEQAAGRTDAGLDPANATRVIVLGGEPALADHIDTEGPDKDPEFARELARIWWYGVYRRPTDHAG